MTEKEFQSLESKEEIETTVEEQIGSISSLFKSAKWQEKVEAYEKLAQWLFDLGIPLDWLEHTIRYCKVQQKDWKESNANIVKAFIQFMQKSFGSAFKVGQRAANVVIPFLADKIGDPKYCAGIQEIILILGEKLTPAFIIKGVSKQGISATNPKVIE